VNRIKFLTFLTFSASLIFLVSNYSCNKIKSTDIGTDLLPIIDNIITFDTTLEVTTENGLVSDTALPSILSVYEGGTPELIAGQINNDVQFGKTSASMFFQFLPSGFPVTFQVLDSLYLDSVVLCMSWNGMVYGDTNQIQKFNVFELDSTLRSDSTYKTNFTTTYKALLGSKTFAPSILNDSLKLLGQSLANQLRIPLNKSFGEALLHPNSINNNPLLSDSLFRSFSKGFAVVPDVNTTSANAIMGFNLGDSNSYIKLYYRYDTASSKDTASIVLRYTTTTGYANNISRNYNNSAAQNSFKAGQDSVVYIQTSPGTNCAIRIPALDIFKAKKGNVVIHKAELSMQQIPSFGQQDDVFSAPDIIYADYFDSASKSLNPFILDGFSQGSYSPALLGGAKKIVNGPLGASIAEYKFNLSRYLQGIVTRNYPNNIIYLSAPNYIQYNKLYILQKANVLAKGRVKLGGGNNKTQKMSLRIVYSKL
jgi:hypothetical protein